MAPRFDTITFLSDYGTDDEFVGVVHSVIRSIAPHVSVIDLTHQIPAYDVRAGSGSRWGARRSTSARVLCSRWSIQGWGPNGTAIAVEVGDGRATSSGRTTACWPRRWP